VRLWPVRIPWPLRFFEEKAPAGVRAEVQRVAAAHELDGLPGTTNVPHTGSRVSFMAGRAAGRGPAAVPDEDEVAPWMMPWSRRQTARATKKSIT
jgi:hypothetical protein